MPAMQQIYAFVGHRHHIWSNFMERGKAFRVGMVFGIAGALEFSIISNELITGFDELSAGNTSDGMP